MIVKTINNKITVVCEKCEEEFKVGQAVSIAILDKEIHRIDIYSNFYFPYLEEPPSIEDNGYYHSACLPIKSAQSTMDDLKESLTSLTQKERVNLYKYFYNAFGCRI